jgi:S-DNA-T family DNA segregation ATPase FtsK/SpoIIIE
VKKKNTLPMPEPEDDEGDPREPNIYNHAAKEDKPEPPAPVKKRSRAWTNGVVRHLREAGHRPLSGESAATGQDRPHRMEEEIKHISTILKDKLAEFGIEVQVMNVNIGPIITRNTSSNPRLA